MTYASNSHPPRSAETGSGTPAERTSGQLQTVPISTFIISENEEARIARAINAIIQWADEVIVLDSGSTDRTCAIAEALGAKVHFREWSGYGPQKRPNLWQRSVNCLLGASPCQAPIGSAS